MNRPKKNPGRVPARWLHCPRKSEKLIVGKFMALKTPLSADFDDQVPQDCRFHPKMMFDYAKIKKINFGMWIDLTNTSRFYKKEEIESYGCQYVKLQCRGHGETPSVEQTNKFIAVVCHFISQHPLHHIAVHCTHGFNRTGFLIVSYLVKVMDYSLGKALGVFSESRPVGIYKSDYIKELYERYDDIEDAPPVPKLPDWCIEDDDDTSIDNFYDNDNLIEEKASTSSNHNHGPPRVKQSRNVPRFMEGVPGVYPFQEAPKYSQLQKKVRNMCGWGRNSFPGSQPVSMDVKNISLLHKKPYRVSWKADGMRYMMLIDGEDEVYFFDRDNNVFKVDGLRFVYRKDITKHLTNTLLDGEMVIDKVNGENIPRFLAYDIVVFDTKKVGEMPFHPVRLYCLENEIIKPRYLAMERGYINKANEPFSVRKKDFWPITQAASLLGEKFAKTLSHEPDGLIFQPSKQPYTPGRCDEVLKWKPLSLNSVDFRLQILKQSSTGCIPKTTGYLFVADKKDTPFAVMKYTPMLKEYNNKIIECKFEGGQWIFMRERVDKSFPNSSETAMAVCESILEPVTKEALISYIEKNRFEDDSEMMPPPSKMMRR